MQNEKTLLYSQALEAFKNVSLTSRAEKKIVPQNYIVATHGPALAKVLCETPETLDMIGIYRVNCSHIGKESDLEALAEYLRTIHKFVPILIDLQGPKPRIHEMGPQGDITVKLGEMLEVTYAPATSEERFCEPGKLRVCFPQIVEVMQIGDVVIFDDGKMSATVREKSGDRAVIECTEILSGKDSFVLGGRKWICVRNRPLGIECITEHDRKSIEFARDILGFDFVDNVMVSYFSTPEDVEHFIRIMRDEYDYTGNLWGKFETPHAVLNAEEILSKNELTLAMLGRGDLRVEMDPRAVVNMHDIQAHFFNSCRKHGIESICATGFLESMLTPEGKVTPEEIYDMETSMTTGPDHLMLSGESTYGAQARASIELECSYQKKMLEKLQTWAVAYRITPALELRELLYIL
jgi:pyruvate kinase